MKQCMDSLTRAVRRVEKRELLRVPYCMPGCLTACCEPYGSQQAQGFSSRLKYN